MEEQAVMVDSNSIKLTFFFGGDYKVHTLCIAPITLSTHTSVPFANDGEESGQLQLCMPFL